MKSILNSDALASVYGSAAGAAGVRFQSLAERFRTCFDGADPAAFFTSPGRTEIIGNHVDHNGGKVLAASIDLDTIAAVKPNGTSNIRVFSEGFHKPAQIDIRHPDNIPKCKGSLSLVAGIIDGVLQRGFRCEGFDACVSSTVPSSAGVSSSASYEMLLLCAINDLFNDGAVSLAERAAIGQYAENVWWEKASGMMDQMACAHGGTVLFDFRDGVSCESVPFSFAETGCDMVLVNSGKGHADLSAEYSSIPDEMRLVASAFGKKILSDMTEDELVARFSDVRKNTGHDRAMLRTLHYFRECRRVEEAVRSIREGHPEKLLPLIAASGNSSWKYLQSCYVTGEATEQPVAVTLALTERFLEDTGEGVCRIHGGGFGGVMMCVLPKLYTKDYINYMAPFTGADNIHVMQIRDKGAIQIR